MPLTFPAPPGSDDPMDLRGGHGMAKLDSGRGVLGWLVLLAAALGPNCGGGGGGGGGAPVPPTLLSPSAGTLQNGTPGSVYRATFMASGSIPITWSVTGTLPPGMSLDPGGQYSGTPTAAGTYNFTVTATNAGGSVSASYTHAIPAGSRGPLIVALAPQPATIGVPLNQVVVIVFSEPMNQASAQAAIGFTPAVTGLAFSWQGNAVTVAHNNFAASTAYQVSVAATAQDAGGAALVPGLEPNPSTFTTGTTTVTAAATTVQQGYALYQAENYPAAIALFQAAISANPADPSTADAYYLLGRSYQQQFNYAQARTEYQNVITNFPASARADDAQFRIGETYYEELSTAAALAALQLTLSQYPSGDFADDAQLLIGKVYHDQLNYAQARIEYGLVIANYPASESADGAQYYIGKTYHDQSNYAQARIEYQLVITNYPMGGKVDDAQYQIGETHYDVDAFLTAMPQFQLVIANYPGSDSADDAQYRLGRCHHRLGVGHYVQARAEYQLVLTNYPSSSKTDDARFRIGMTYHDEANYASEVTALNALITAQPYSSRVPEAQSHLNDIAGPGSFHP